LFFRVEKPDHYFAILEANMLQRILGVFKLSKATFEEIEGDQSATT